MALALRTTVFLLGSDVPTFDERGYTEVAESLATGGGFERGGRSETHILPLFPALHAVPIAMGLDPHLAGRAAGLLTSAMAVPAALWALTPLVGRRWALSGALLVLLHPRLLVTAERIQPEALAAFWLLLIAGFWARAIVSRSRSWRPHIGVGVAIGGAYLTRPEGLLVLPALWLAALAVDRRAWRRWSLATAVALLAAAPYLFYLRTVTGDWTLTGKAEWVYTLGRVEAVSGNRPIAPESLADERYQVGSLLDHLRTDPGAAIADYGIRAGLALRYLAAAAGWPLMLVGLAGILVAAARDRIAIGWLLPLALLAVIPLSVVHARHLLPYLPVVLSGVALFGLRRRDRR